MSSHLKRQSWLGLKRHVKRFLGWRIPNAALRIAARFFPVLRSGRWPAPASLIEVEGRVGRATYVMLDPARCENAKELFWGQGRRPIARDRLALDTVVSLAREADVFLDVGAYTGLFTMATTAVAPNISVHAFEIVPAVWEALGANVRRNGVDDRVTVHRGGIGPDGTSVTMPTGEGGSALPSFYSTAMAFDRGQVVSLRSLDSVGELIPEGSRVVMKVDVEGTEDQVFASGRRFLQTYRPHILCEVLHGRAHADLLETLLEPAELRRYLVTDTALVERPRIAPHQRFRDWLFSRSSPAELRVCGLPVVDLGHGE